MTGDNRRRALADVIDVEAWHREFSSAVDRAHLFVDVTFGVGRVGGEPESPVRFQMSLRRAEIVVVIPATEPATANIESVLRLAPQVATEAVSSKKTAIDASASAAIAGALGQPRIDAVARLQGAITRSQATNVQVTETGGSMRLVQSRTEDGSYRWVVTAFSGILDGKPWDAGSNSLVEVIDTRKDRSGGIEPAIRVQIKCRREDLIIEKLTLKDRGSWNKIKNGLNFKNKLAAAEAAVRNYLSEEGLFHNDISDPYVMMTLAEVTARGVRQ